MILYCPVIPGVPLVGQISVVHLGQPGEQDYAAVPENLQQIKI